MPSPVAHAGLVLLARPWLARQRLTSRRRWLCYGVLGLTLCGPDLDFVMMMVSDHPMHQHGTFLHSFMAAVAFAPLFAVVMRMILGRTANLLMLMLVGFAAYGSHLIMDLFTPGRGVMLLWPITTQRFSSPLALFVGAHHSQPWAWRLHLITLTSEVAFLALVWLVARRLMLKRLLLGTAERAMHRL